MQEEWKIRKSLVIAFPTCERAVDKLCQTTMKVNGIRYRKHLLNISTTHHKMVHTFLTEVEHSRVDVFDKCWRDRFSKIGTSDIPIQKEKIEQQDDDDEEFVL